MATPELSRRRRQRGAGAAPGDPGGTSRADLKRAAQERRMERQFAWAFVVTVSLTTLYLVWRLPWGHQIVSRLH